MALDDLEKRFDAKIEALRLSSTDAKQNQRDPIYYLAIGALGMGVLFALLLGLAVLYGGFR